MAIAVQMDYRVDLCKPVHLIQMDVPFFKGDKNAHRFHVTLERNGCAIDVKDLSATGYMVRADKQTVIWDAQVDGCDIYLTMPAACYAVAGCFRLLLRVTSGDTVETALWVEGSIRESVTDAIVDPEDKLPSLNELIEQIERVEAMANMTVEAETLAPGSEATASYEDGVLTIGIPQSSGGSGGGGLPTGGAAHQMLVTDADGNALWEDRTHYAYTGMVDILPETTVEVDPESGEGYVTEPLAGSLVAGNEYTVTYNGAEYVCRAQEVQTDVVMVCLGNIGLVEGGADTGEPFVFMAIPPETAAAMGVYAGLYALDGSSTVVIKVSNEGEIVHKIPGKFLPEKTHWVNEQDVEILPETTVPVQQNTIVAIGTSLNAAIEPCIEYTVTWNGTEYRCVAENFVYGGDVAGATLGSTELFGGSQIDVPFGFIFVHPAYVAAVGLSNAVVSRDSSTSATFAIIEPAGTVHKLDAKFLPPGVVTSINDKTGAVNLTAEDVGADAKGTAQTLISRIPVYAGSGLSSLRGAGAAAEGDTYKMAASAVALGEGCQSMGRASFSACRHTEAKKLAASAIGHGTIASGEAQHVQGKYNVEDTEGRYAHIVGNGESDTARSNAHTIDWDGNAWFAGYVEGTKLILPSPNGTRWAITVGDDGTLSAAAVTE